ncbi:MAG TPA: hypothetical protein VM513_14350 [Kofleriaceae bacterium]|nr:hypothetical protein [Kofleriaceae bacterium]
MRDPRWLAGEPRAEVAAAVLAEEGDAADEQALQPLRGVTERADVGAQAGEREEHRQEQRVHDGRDAGLPFEDEPAVRVQRDAEHEAADQGVEAEMAGRERAPEGRHHHDRDRGVLEAIVAREVAIEVAEQERAQPPRHQRRDRDEPPQPEGDPLDGEVAGDQQRDPAEEQPPDDVADRGGADRDRAGTRRREAGLGEDSTEHGERGDRHRHREDQREAVARWAWLGERGVEEARGDQAEGKRNHDAEHADQHDGALGLEADRDVELEADLEHEQHEPDRSEHRERGIAAVLEHVGEAVRPHQPEQRRSEHDAREHFPDDLGLPEPLRAKGDQARHRDDDDQLEEERLFG